MNPAFTSLAETIISSIFLLILLILLIISIYIIRIKKHIANLRGQTLMSMMILFHCISIGYPNVLTILNFSGHPYLPRFGYFNSCTDLFATIILTVLICTRAIFMNLKANNKVISNLRGVILTVNLYIGSIFIFLMICFKPSIPYSLFPILNFEMDKLSNSAYDFKGLAITICFYLSFLIVHGLTEWGAYSEMRALVFLRIFDMTTMGIVLSSTSQNWLFLLQVNIYRALLMIFNTFFFLWYYDKTKNTCISDLQMEILRATDWNPCLTQMFIKYLLHNHQESLVNFFIENIKDNGSAWKFIQNPIGIVITS